MSTITIQSEGRRHYIVGNTFPIKDQLRAAGCKWDGARRAWWTGKRDVAESLVASPVNSEATPDSRPEGGDGLSEESKIAGKATYKGRAYLLVWEGETRRGRAAKLAFADGKKVFWADMAEVTVTKRYESREDRWGRREHMTFGRLQRLRENYAAAKAEGNDDGIRNGQRYECEECGEWVTRGEGSCWETGSGH